jgi:hypothetical protein
MALGRVSCSDTTWTIEKLSVGVMCQWIKTMATDLTRSDIERLEKCCISDEMDGIEDGEEIENVGRKLERFNSVCETEDGNCEDTEAETDDRNGEQSETGKAE